MATIHREFDVKSDPENAWKALRNVGGINKLITFLGEVTVEGDHRSCSLGDQGTLNELIVSVDDGLKRVAYSIQESPLNFEFHSASMQVVPNNGHGAKFVWTTDLKPDALAPAFAELIDQAVESFKTTL